MLTVHHLEHSRSTRILWLLEELQVPYQLVNHARGSNMRAPDGAKEIHPLGKFPIVIDNEHVLAESGAIFAYLLDRYDFTGLVPAPISDDKIRYNYWMNFTEGSLMPNVYLGLVFDQVGKSRVPFFARSILKKIVSKTTEGYINVEIAEKINYIESQLAHTKWSCGANFSAADIMLGTTLIGLKERFTYITNEHPNILRYISELEQRPAYQRLLSKSGEKHQLPADDLVDAMVEHESTNEN